MSKNIWKSIGAILLGFVTVVILSTVTDALLQTLGIFPSVRSGISYSTWMLIIALLYRSVYTVIGGYVTARFAPINKMGHVKILGILGIIGGTIGVISGWNLSSHWYPILLAVTAYPLTWIGGKINKK